MLCGLNNIEFNFCLWNYDYINVFITSIYDHFISIWLISFISNYWNNWTSFSFIIAIILYFLVAIFTDLILYLLWKHLDKKYKINKFWKISKIFLIYPLRLIPIIWFLSPILLGVSRLWKMLNVIVSFWTIIINLLIIKVLHNYINESFWWFFNLLWADINNLYNYWWINLSYIWFLWFYLIIWTLFYVLYVWIKILNK